MPSSASLFKLIAPTPRTPSALLALLKVRPLLFTPDGYRIHPIREGKVDFSPFADKVIQLQPSQSLLHCDPVHKQIRDLWRERKWDKARIFCESEIAKLDLGYARILLVTDLPHTFLILGDYSAAIRCYQICEAYFLSKPLPDYRDLAVSIAEIFMGEGDKAYQRLNRNLDSLRDYMARNPAQRVSLRTVLVLMLENLSVMERYLDYPETSERLHTEAAAVIDSTPQLKPLADILAKRNFTPDVSRAHS